MKAFNKRLETEMIKSELAKQIYAVSHLVGSFQLRSGRISSEYFDKYQFEANPSLLDAIVKQMVNLIPSDTEVLAGLELGAISIVTLLSQYSGYYFRQNTVIQSAYCILLDNSISSLIP